MLHQIYFNARIYVDYDLVGILAVADHPPRNELSAAIVPNTPTHVYKTSKEHRSNDRQVVCKSLRNMSQAFRTPSNYPARQGKHRINGSLSANESGSFRKGTVMS